MTQKLTWEYYLKLDGSLDLRKGGKMIQIGKLSRRITDVSPAIKFS
jgi:hypothetical protein